MVICHKTKPNQTNFFFKYRSTCLQFNRKLSLSEALFTRWLKRDSKYKILFRTVKWPPLVTLVPGCVINKKGSILVALAVGERNCHT